MLTKPPKKTRQTVTSQAARMSDIANALGLTTATVSCALSGKGRVAPQTRQAVLEAAQNLGFEPNPHAARLKAGRCPDTVCLFIPNLDFGVGTRKVQLLQTLLTQRGYRVTTHVCRGEYQHPDIDLHTSVMRNLRLQRPQGIICSTADLATDSKDVLCELQLYCEGGGFAVTYDALPSLDIGCDGVLFDREHNTYTATRHLLELGHRHIVFYGGWEEPIPQRLKGYIKALGEFGLTPQSNWILPGREIGAQSPHLAEPNFDEENGSRLAEMFLALQPRPTAACITNDAIAVAFVTGLMRRGLRVPEDVSVIGQDNLPVAEYSSFVPLTTVSQPVNAIAEHVVDLMMQRINGEVSGPARHVPLRGDLVLRSSTAPLTSRTPHKTSVRHQEVS